MFHLTEKSFGAPGQAERGIVLPGGKPAAKESFAMRAKRDFLRNHELYLLMLPILAYYIIFQYGPLFGLTIAFKNYTPGKGFFESPWVGLRHFRAFFSDYYFLRVLKNTIIISWSNLVFAFPMPIILALLLNELKSSRFSRIVQTITYMPHFISTVIISGMIIMLTGKDGVITQFFNMFGLPSTAMLNNPRLFVPIFVISGVWQNIGWNSIIFLSALTAIDQELYEAARIDGAGRFRQLLNITLPGLMPTIVIMLILQIGRMFNIGHEKIMLLYNPLTYETADVISTYVYRKGLLEMNWSFSSAVGLFNSVVSFVLVFTTNWISRHTNETSLW